MAGVMFLKTGFSSGKGSISSSHLKSGKTDKKYGEFRNFWKIFCSCGKGRKFLRKKAPEFGAEPAYDAPRHQIDDPPLTAIDFGIAGRFRFEQQVVVLQLAPHN